MEEESKGEGSSNAQKSLDSNKLHRVGGLRALQKQQNRPRGGGSDILSRPFLQTETSTSTHGSASSLSQSDGGVHKGKGQGSLKLAGTSLGSQSIEAMLASGGGKVSAEVAEALGGLAPQAFQYRILVQLLNDNLFFVKTLSQLIDQADYDRVAKVLVNISTPPGYILPLIRSIVSAEFERNFRNPGSILRGNCVASKLMAAYARKSGAAWIEDCVGKVVLRVIQDESLSLEINPTFLRRTIQSESEVESAMKKNGKKLLAMAQEVLDRIIDMKRLEKMSRNVRALCGFTAEYARMYAADRLVPLVGGFIMLRLVNPALVTPETFSFLPKGTIPSRPARRNLTLISKLMQNLSNGILFGSKEEYMCPMNVFIESNTSAMQSFLSHLATDPRDEDWEDCRKPLTRNVEYKDLQKSDLLILHKLLYLYKGKLLEAVYNEATSQTAAGSGGSSRIGGVGSRIANGTLSSKNGAGIGNPGGRAGSVVCEEEATYDYQEEECFFRILDELGEPPGARKDNSARDQDLPETVSFLRPPDKSGFLATRGRLLKRGRKKRYWYVVSGNFLHYFSNPADTKPRQSIPLEELSVFAGSGSGGGSTSSISNTSSHMGGDVESCSFTFAYMRKERTVYCESVQSVMDWIEIVSAAQQRRWRSDDVPTASSTKHLGKLETRMRMHLTGLRQSYECKFVGFELDASGLLVFLWDIVAFDITWRIKRRYGELLALLDDLCVEFPRIIFPSFPRKLVDPLDRIRGRGGHNIMQLATNLNSKLKDKLVSHDETHEDSDEDLESDDELLEKRGASASVVGTSAATGRGGGNSSGHAVTGKKAGSKIAGDRGDGDVSDDESGSLLKKSGEHHAGSFLPGDLRSSSSDIRPGEQIAMSNLIAVEDASPWVLSIQNGCPSAGVIYACKFLKVFMQELLVNFKVSQSNLMFSFLELSSPHRAVRESCAAQLHYLASEQADLDQVDRHGLTAMHLAAALPDRADMIRLLHDLGANIEAKDRAGNRPLHLALRSRYGLEAAHVLLALGADVNVQNAALSTPLHVAADEGHLEAMQKMVAEEGSIAKVNLSDKRGRSPLQLAVAGAHDALACFLIQHKADVRVCDNRGNTPLHLVVRHSLASTMNALLANSAVDVNARNRHGVTPLHYAAHRGCATFVALFLQHPQMDVAALDGEGRTPLMVAALRGHASVCSLLVNQVDVDIRSKNGDTALHAAAQGGHWEALHVIASVRPNLNARNELGFTPLHMAVLGGHAHAVRTLLDGGADPNAADRRGRCPLHLAAVRGRSDVITSLIGGGANLQSTDGEGSSPLHVCLWAGYEDLAKVLIEAGADVNAADTVWGATPLHIAATHALPNAVSYLLQHDADVSVRQLDSRTPLMVAVCNERSMGGRVAQTAIALIKHAPKHVNEQDEKGNTALHFAVSRQLREIALCLVHYGADIRLCNKAGTGPLHQCKSKLKQELISEFEVNQS